MNCKNIVKGKKGFASRPMEERFFEKIKKGPTEDSCWIWSGSKCRGYGLFYINGRNERAHRVSWELFHKKSFPTGLNACHSCDNPSCVNPRHIWPGTQTENAADMMRKGRFKRGVTWSKTPRPPDLKCRNGHPREGSVVFDFMGRKFCRICKSIAAAKHRAKNKKLYGYVHKPKNASLKYKGE